MGDGGGATVLLRGMTTGIEGCNWREERRQKRSSALSQFNLHFILQCIDLWQANVWLHLDQQATGHQQVAPQQKDTCAGQFGLRRARANTGEEE